MDLHCRRHEFGNDEIMAKAMEHPEHKMLRTKPKAKNTTKGTFPGEQRGRIHVDIRDQNVDKLNIKKMKPLRDRNRGSKFSDSRTARMKTKNRNKKRNRMMKGWRDPNEIKE